jgi:hypothetical protein
VWSLVAKTPVGLIVAAANTPAVAEIRVEDPATAAAVRAKTTQAKVAVR